MTEEPRLPRKLKRDDGAEYLTGIRIAGYTDLKDVFTVKPRTGAYCKYTELTEIVHEES